MEGYLKLIRLQCIIQCFLSFEVLPYLQTVLMQLADLLTLRKTAVSVRNGEAPCLRAIISHGRGRPIHSQY